MQIYRENSKLRLFLVDDHEFLREGLKTLLHRQPDMRVVGEAGNGEDACQMMQSCRPEARPDIIIMDLSMPGLNGSQATINLKKVCPEVHVLVLSMHEETTYLRALLEVGASGYVLKRSASQELVKAIRSVASGRIYLDPALAEKVTTDYVNRTAVLRGELIGNDLSDRESAVLRMVAQGYTGKEIAAEIGISQKTVETYKIRALEKIGIESRPEIIRYAVLKGWLQDF